MTRGVSLAGEVVDEETGVGVPNVRVEQTLRGPYVKSEDETPFVYYSDVADVRTEVGVGSCCVVHGA